MSLRIRFANCRGWMLLAACFLGANPMHALSQQPAPLPKVFDQKIQVTAAKSSLDEFLVMLTKLTHVSILVDGEPLLQKADMSLDGSLHDALDKVADVFDYSWTLAKSGVVLMSKRFKNPDERPQMNAPEMLEMARNVVKALTVVDYEKDETQANDLVKRVAQTFTAEETKAMLSETKLHGSDLLPAQRTDIQQAVLTRSFLPALKLWEALEPLLQNIKRSSMQAKPRTPAPGQTWPTHDYFYLYSGANGVLHSFEIRHLSYGHNNVEIRTP